MVSLENKISYIQRIKENPKLSVFHYLLLGETITPSSYNNLSDADEQFLEILSSIQTNNKGQFEQIYKKKSKSNPSKDSQMPFINDDFLIFCLIIGVAKFNIDKNWIKNIVSIRSRNEITTTFEDILNDNYFSTNNLHEIVLIYFQITNPSLITNEFLVNTYKSINVYTNLFENRSDFRILCAIRAYDLIIEFKESSDGSEISLLKQFNRKFLYRVKILAFIIQLIIMLIFLFILLKLFSLVPFIKELFDKYDPIFGILGLSVLGSYIPIFRKAIYKLTLKLLGHPKELYEKSNNKLN